MSYIGILLISIGVGILSAHTVLFMLYDFPTELHGVFVIAAGMLCFKLQPY